MLIRTLKRLKSHRCSACAPYAQSKPTAPIARRHRPGTTHTIPHRLRRLTAPLGQARARRTPGCSRSMMMRKGLGRRTQRCRHCVRIQRNKLWRMLETETVAFTNTAAHTTQTVNRLARMLSLPAAAGLLTHLPQVTAAVPPAMSPHCVRTRLVLQPSPALLGPRRVFSPLPLNVAATEEERRAVAVAVVLGGGGVMSSGTGHH